MSCTKRTVLSARAVKMETMIRGETPLKLNIGTRRTWAVNFTPRRPYPRERTPVPTHWTHISHLSITDNVQGTVYLYKYWPPVSFPPIVGNRRARQGKHQYFVNCQGDISSCKYECLSNTPIVNIAWQLFTWLLVQMNNRRICQIHQPWERFLLR